MNKQMGLALSLLLCFPNPSCPADHKTRTTKKPSTAQANKNIIHIRNTQELQALIKRYKKLQKKRKQSPQVRKYKRSLKIILQAIVSIVGSAFLCYIATLRIMSGNAC